MKKLALKLVFSLFVVLTAIALYSTSFAATTFTDIGGVEFQSSIQFLSDRGAVVGFDDGTFRPFAHVTRAEMMKMLTILNFDEATIGTTGNCFLDVKDQWFAQYVCFAKERGFVQGYGTGKIFKPGNDVAMVEALKMAAKAFGHVLPEPAAKDQWYVPFVNFAHTNNIFSKFSYLPGTAMTRQQMAYMMHQLILIKEGQKQLSTVRVNLSAGCGVMPPRRAPTTSNINGIDRNYITVIPDDYDKDEPKKLVFAFHGRTNSNEMVRGYYRVEQAADDEAIFIYPAGIKRGSSYTWSDGGDKAHNLRDFALFDQLLWQFADQYCIDLDHVYVVGHSLGAWFTNALGCNRGNVIRAIGSLGGGTTGGSCNGPAAAMVWHNPKDALASFSSGEVARNTFLEQNQCARETYEVEPRAGSCVRYVGCEKHAPVVWCPHTMDYASWDGSYYTHNWPAITGPEIWKFFKSLPQ